MNTNLHFHANFYVETNIDDIIFDKSNLRNITTNKPSNDFTVCNIIINKTNLLKVLLPQLRDYCKQTLLSLPMTDNLESEPNFNDLAVSMIRINKMVSNKLYSAPTKIYYGLKFLNRPYPLKAWNDKIILEVRLYTKDNIPIFMVKSALLEKFMECSVHKNRLVNVEVTSNGIGSHYTPSESLFKKIRIMYKHSISSNKEVVMNPETLNNTITSLVDKITNNNTLTFLNDVMTSIFNINELCKKRVVYFTANNQTPIVVRHISYSVNGLTQAVSINVNGNMTCVTLLNNAHLTNFISMLSMLTTINLSLPTVLAKVV